MSGGRRQRPRLTLSHYLNPDQLHLAMMVMMMMLQEAEERAAELRRFADCCRLRLFSLGDTVTPAGHLNQCNPKPRKGK